MGPGRVAFPVKWLVGLLLGLLFLVGAVALAAGLVTVPFLIDLLWFDALGYDFYFWQRLLYRYAIFGVAGAAFFLFFFVNFRFASRQMARAGGAASVSPVIHRIRTASLWVSIPVSILLAGFAAYPLFQNWEQFLLFLFGPGAGIPDPVFGRDVSYYLFSLPLFTLIQGRLLLASALLVGAIAIYYHFERGFLAKEDKHLPPGARWHRGALVLVAVLLYAWGLILQRHSLVFTARHEPLFYGPGYVEMVVVARFLIAEAALVLAAGLALAIAVGRRRGLLPAAVLGLSFLLVFGARETGILSTLLQKYVVQPNEFEREKPYLENNIAATTHAYQLDDVDVRDFRRQYALSGVGEANLEAQLRNVPLWEDTQLRDVYRELQELRTYYSFPNVSVGRYAIQESRQQVFLAARELDYAELPPAAENWINRHLMYTHGYGLVMTPASQAGGEPLVWFIRGIPLSSEFGFGVKRPQVYFGVGEFTNYVIAPNATGELDYPAEDSLVTSRYEGTGGVDVSSLLARSLFAYHFWDKNLLFSTRLAEDSRILFRRNVIDRVRRLAPFLILDDAVYLVATPERLYWIQDAYTVSDHYPDSQPTVLHGSRVNYLRNSVKAVVDAYDGSIDLYIFEPGDPVVRAYDRIYPGLFKPRGDLPEELAPHIRYPKDFLESQMRIYAKYHQKDPETFYQQEDVWDFAETVRGDTPEEIRPYFLTLDLIRQGELDFLLVQPMSPKGRDNLRSVMVAGCDGENYGKLVLYSFPKGEIVYSPVQMEALINADPEIAQQFTLWDQAESNVVRGKMIILPIENQVLYIQPVYIRATSRYRIPRLERVVMSDGQVAVMAPSLQEAYRKLEKRVKNAAAERQKRFPFE